MSAAIGLVFIIIALLFAGAVGWGSALDEEYPCELHFAFAVLCGVAGWAIAVFF